jgi:hypothetical protein
MTATSVAFVQSKFTPSRAATASSERERCANDRIAPSDGMLLAAHDCFEARRESHGDTFMETNDHEVAER